MAKLTYWQKLKDPRWQKLRLEKLESNDFCCEVCGDGTSTLHVHHKEYFRGLEPWEYELNQLAVLCESCHETEHDNFDLLKWVCSNALLDGPNNRTELAFVIGGYMGINFKGMLTLSCLEFHDAYKRYYDAGVKAQKAQQASTNKYLEKIRAERHGEN